MAWILFLGAVVNLKLVLLLSLCVSKEILNILCTIVVANMDPFFLQSLVHGIYEGCGMIIYGFEIKT